jgi:hypothetical protein
MYHQESVWEFEFINFENEQQWIIIVIGQQNELRKSLALKNQFFTLNGSFLG